MATYTPPPYFPQGSLAPPDKSRYRKFKIVMALAGAADRWIDRCRRLWHMVFDCTGVLELGAFRVQALACASLNIKLDKLKLEL